MFSINKTPLEFDLLKVFVQTGKPLYSNYMPTPHFLLTDVHAK
jgi:hypothetical protein